MRLRGFRISQRLTVIASTHTSFPCAWQQDCKETELVKAAGNHAYIINMRSDIIDQFIIWQAAAFNCASRPPEIRKRPSGEYCKAVTGILWLRSSGSDHKSDDVIRKAGLYCPLLPSAHLSSESTLIAMVRSGIVDDLWGKL